MSNRVTNVQQSDTQGLADNNNKQNGAMPIVPDIEDRLSYLRKVVGIDIPKGKKLNLGCGLVQFPHNEGWVNIDHNQYTNPDMVRVLDSEPWRLGRNNFDFCIISHLVEHLKDLIFFMKELYNVMTPDSLIFICSPYAWSDNAIEDPTHCRFINENTFAYFDRAHPESNNGYASFDVDFECKNVVMVPYEKFNKTDVETVDKMRSHNINIIREVQHLLRVVKPKRQMTLKSDVKRGLVLPDEPGRIIKP